MSLDRDVLPRADIADLPREDQHHTRFGVLVRHCGAERTATKHGEKIGAHKNGELPSHKLDECSVRQDVNHMKTTKIQT